MRTTVTMLALCALAAPAFADGARADAAIVGLAFYPCLFMLLAAPAAILLRATTGLPSRVEAGLGVRGHGARLLGALLFAAMLVLLSVAKDRGAGAGTWLVVAFGALLLLGLTVAAVRTGRALFREPGRGESVGAFALGWLLLAGLSLLPLLGVLALLWQASLGLGALALAPFRK
jgi:hypothetical protein